MDNHIIFLISNTGPNGQVFHKQSTSAAFELHLV